MRKLQETIDDIWELRKLHKLDFDTNLQKMLISDFNIRLSECCKAEITLTSPVIYRCDECNKSFLV